MATPQTSHIPPLADITPSYGATSSSSTLPLCGPARSDCVALSPAPEPAWRARLRLDQSPSILPASPRAPFKRSRSYSETSSSSARLESPRKTQPFVLEQLDDLPTPVTPCCLVLLYGNSLDVLETLPDASSDSQARLLKFIAGFIRMYGFVCTYGFNSMPLEQVRAVVQQDPALSAVLRIAFESTYKVYPLVLSRIVRYVCLGPPDYKSPKSVHFAPEPMFVEAEDIEEPEPEPSNIRTLSPNCIRTFDVDKLSRMPNPFSSDTMVILVCSFCEKMVHLGKALDGELRILQLVLDVMLEHELVQPQGLLGLNEAELGDMLRRDPAFSDILRRLVLEKWTMFGKDFPLVLRHIFVLQNTS